MLRKALLAACLVLIVPAAAAAAAAAKAYTPPQKALYRDGPTGRYLLGGTWQFRLASTKGWTPVSVPNAWNANDDSEASMAGTVGSYRKDFRLPSSSSAYDWIVRFESVNYRADVWLNGRRIGSNTGAYLPFELHLDHLKRHGTNRLVVRVDNRRKPTDFPPSGLSAEGEQVGGWWNYGGILREVYLRRVDRLDLRNVVVRPELPCTHCAATVDFSTEVHNYAPHAQAVRVTGGFGPRHLSLGTQTIPAGSTRVFTGSTRVAHPKLWGIGDPHLYRARLDAATVGPTGATPRATYRLHTGIRRIEVKDGRLMLNGRFLHLRGVGLHEDAKGVGFAIDNKVRRRFIAETRDLGATIIRAHYPLHPYLEELADRKGILLWSEIPVYGVKTEYLTSAAVRHAAVELLERNIATNQNHASIGMWSIANELSARPGRSQGYYIARAAHTAHRLDPTRPVGLAVAGYPSAGCQSEYAPLDILGLNDYFGWYPGPNGQIADRTLLPAYLDQLRACYPHHALMVTEFGAEANRHGPVEERGTYEFQQDFIDYHLGVFAQKPWLSGAIYWALQEFKVRPGWDGGNPHPDPPIHEKGLISYSGEKKPAYAEIRKSYRATKQVLEP